MRYEVRTVTAPAEIAPPVSLEEARQELRVEAGDSAEDALIAAKLAAAVDQVERFTGQVLSPREMELVLDGFPGLPELVSIPRAPVTGILSIAYVSPADGATVLLADGGWRWSDADPATLRPPFRSAWPAAAAERGSVRIRFTAGYEAGLVPAALLQAVKALTVRWYDERGSADVPADVLDLMRPFRRLIV